jgi:hypothetical protein
VILHDALSSESCLLGHVYSTVRVAAGGHHGNVDPQWGAIAPMVGGVLAALVGGTLGGWLAHRSQRSNWTRDSRMTAYADLLRYHAVAYDKLARRLAHGERERIDWSDWHRALAVVNIVAPAVVADQAVKLDEAMWRLTIDVRQGDIDGWIQMRRPVEHALLEFVNLARTELDGSSARLKRVNGRPREDDPVWRLHEDSGP